MNITLLKVVVGMFILSAGTSTALAASEVDILREFAPMNNNSCPHLSPIPFTTVILQPGMKCSDTAGVTNIMSQVNRWLPRNAQRPRIALLMKKEDGNAFFSVFGLHVPLRIQGENAPAGLPGRFFPGALSRAVVAHEYGHAVLNFTLATFNGEFRNEQAQIYAYSEQLVIQEIIQVRMVLEGQKLQTTFVEKYGPVDKWTKQQAAEFQAASVRLTKKFDRALGASQLMLEKVNSQINNRISVHHQILSSYHELFADLIAILDSRDWAISGKVIAALAGNPAAGVPRDFTNPANSYESLESSSSRFEAHELLGPARYALFKRLKDNRCLNPNPTQLVGAVIDAIFEHSRTAIGTSHPQTPAQRIGFNRSFTQALNWRLDRLGQVSLCE